MGVDSKAKGFQMSPEKQETLLKMSILSVAAVLCKLNDSNIILELCQL